MFPIGDEDTGDTGIPWITLLLIGANVLVFLYEITLGQDQLNQFFMTYGAVPTQITQGQNLFSLLTSMFLHGGWMHIFSNMLSLWIFGDNVEAVLGKPFYLGFYLLGGMAGSLVHILFSLGSNTPSLGASGAIAAVMGAYVVMFPKARVRVVWFLGWFARVTRVTAFIFVGFWLLLQLLNGVAALGAATAQTGGIAYWAHIGGIAFGFLVGILARAFPRLDEKREALVRTT